MITYRSNKSGTLFAAYSGACRVGYVEQRASFTQPGWRWQLILLRPEGGAYWGFVDSHGEAVAALEASFTHWTVEAGLQPKTTEKSNDKDRSERERVEPDVPDGARVARKGNDKEDEPKQRVGSRASRRVDGGNDDSRKRTTRPKAKRGRTGKVGR